MFSPEFTDLVEGLPASMDALMSMQPVTLDTLPPRRDMPKSGIYLWTEGGDHSYVGRARRIRERLQEHARESSGHNQASFAFLLARESTGRVAASYSTSGSRNELLLYADFMTAFREAKARLRCMELRFVEEAHPIRQCLLEVYVAVTLKARYNDFDSH